MIGSHISLFAGIGGIDIAAEAAGFKTIATAEIDPFCRGLLAHRFPSAWRFTDVRIVSAEHFLRASGTQHQRPLLISGGFPCQDVSAPSSTGTGVSGAHSGLWGEFARVIGEFRPEYVLIENVALLRKRGLDVVLMDLASLGYDARWDCIPAAAVGAPHLRDRLYVWAKPQGAKVNSYRDPAYIGYAITVGCFSDDWQGSAQRLTELPRAGSMIGSVLHSETPSYPISAVRASLNGRKMWPTPTKSDGSGGPGTTPKRTGGMNLRTAVAQVNGNGRLHPLWVESIMGFPYSWTNPIPRNDDLDPFPGFVAAPFPLTANYRVPDRAKRIRALGNAVVPQVAAIALDNLLNWK